MPELALENEQRLRRATVLVQLGELREAEMDVAQVLEGCPEHLDALSLYAKIKHMRGELSLAIACGAQLQAKRAASVESARMHLESMLRLAQDPERGAGEFVAVGQFQLIQKPTAYLALESAFHLYVVRRPNEARSMCRQVANRYRERDAEVYKLAVLAEAWISEMMGELPAACEILESLGTDRGYETDLDRVMALVSLYERIGTREKLESAVNICRYLERSYAASRILGRLALLHRRLGQPALAADYERRHLVAYRKVMHRPTFADVLRVAAEDYLPIVKLRAIPFEDGGPPADAAPRERAIAAAIRGDLAESRALLSSGAELLDRKYLAEVEDLENGSDRAARLYAEVLREDPQDLHVITRVLDIELSRHSPPIAEVFRDPALAARALSALEAVVQANPADAMLWRRLAAFFGLLRGGKEQQLQFAERAAAVEQSTRAIGRALSAATYHFMGKAQGLIHEVWATREMAAPGRGGALHKDDILGNLTSEMKDNVRNTFLAVREFAQAKFPHITQDLYGYNYFYKVTKEDEPSGGTSAGLPTALAFLSVFLQKPLPQDVASTGTVVTDSHDVLMVGPVGDAEHKIEAAYHRNLRKILVPAANRAQVEQGGTIPPAITAETVRFVSSLDEALKEVFPEDTLL